MCHSYINAARLLGFTLKIATPAGYAPDADILARGGDQVVVCDSAHQAAENADLVVTDVWASMGDEQSREKRLADFAEHQVDEALMRQAKTDALFMHCLPAHRGEEITADVLDGPQSVVFDQSENRLHIQKAIIVWLLQ